MASLQKTDVYTLRLLLLRNLNACIHVSIYRIYKHSVNILIGNFPMMRKYILYVTE